MLGHRPLCTPAREAAGQAKAGRNLLNLLDRRIRPPLSQHQVGQLTPAVVRDWYSKLDSTKPRQRAHTYALHRTICTTAVDNELLSANPCRIRGAGQAKRASETEPAIPDELAVISAEMPPRLRLMVLLAAWCARRYGELAELRRHDLNISTGVVRVRRAVVWVNSAAIVGDPKSEAGERDVTIPPHAMPAVTEHLAAMGNGDSYVLLVPATTDPTRHLPAPRV